MSSTSMIQPSDTDFMALIAKVKTISFRERVLFRPVLEALLDIIKNPGNTSPILHKWLSEAQVALNVEKINVCEMTMSRIVNIFGLGKEQAWSLVEDDLVEVPLLLKRNLQDLYDTFYDEESEATCRIAVDIMLIQCRKYLRKKYESTDPSIPIGNDPRVEPSKRVKLFPEASLSVEIHDQSEPYHTILVTGRVDWAFGYSMDGDKGALLAAITKQRSEFSKGKAQLIAYLAILRENRRQAEKINTTTQGFYTDGKQYRFVCITADGTISQSRNFEIGQVGDLKMIFNFMVTIFEAAMKSTPNALSEKPGRQQEKEVRQFNDEVWVKIFRLAEKIMAIDSDDDMEDKVDLS